MLVAITLSMHKLIHCSLIVTLSRRAYIYCSEMLSVDKPQRVFFLARTAFSYCAVAQRRSFGFRAMCLRWLKNFRGRRYARKHIIIKQAGDICGQLMDVHQMRTHHAIVTHFAATRRVP